MLPDGDLEMKEYEPENSRYDHYLALWGKTLQTRVSNLRFFLVGAGAIGCEMLKNWALVRPLAYCMIDNENE